MKRFSLKFLFAVITLLIVFLGYSQWRRRDIRAKCAFLNGQGLRVDVPSEWQDRVWQRTPAVAEFKATPLEISGVPLTLYDSKNHNVLNALGISKVRVEANNWNAVYRILQERELTLTDDYPDTIQHEIAVRY
jgi:hypothetical protein